jgi:hypothetical protein
VDIDIDRVLGSLVGAGIKRWIELGTKFGE